MGKISTFLFKPHCVQLKHEILFYAVESEQKKIKLKTIILENIKTRLIIIPSINDIRYANYPDNKDCRINIH